MIANLLASINSVDIIILCIIISSTLLGIKKGLFNSILKSMSTLIAIIGAIYLRTIFSDFIRKSPIYTLAKNSIVSKMGIKNAIIHTQAEEMVAINDLNLPANFKDLLIDNKNPVMYNLLNVDSFTDYIGGYIANIIINIIIGIIVFIVLFICIKALLKALEFTLEVPIIKQVNHLGGGVLGFLWGILIIWIIMIILTIFITNESVLIIIDKISNSTLGSWLYEHNLILNNVLKRLFGGL